MLGCVYFPNPELKEKHHKRSYGVCESSPEGIFLGGCVYLSYFLYTSIWLDYSVNLNA